MLTLTPTEAAAPVLTSAQQAQLTPDAFCRQWHGCDPADPYSVKRARACHRLSVLLTLCDGLEVNAEALAAYPDVEGRAADIRALRETEELSREEVIEMTGGRSVPR